MELKEGQIIPKGYGIAYLNVNKLSAVAYPIPFNVVVGVIRKVWMGLRNGEWYKTGFDTGYTVGKREGRSYAFSQYKEQVFKQNLREILARFLDVESECLREPDKEKTNGWILKFIDDEFARLDRKA